MSISSSGAAADPEKENRLLPKSCILVCCLVISSLFLFFSERICTANEEPELQATPIFRSITPKVASRLIVEKKDLIVVDVRTEEEHVLMAIDNSVLIPVRQILGGKLPLSAEQPVLLYCAVGGRSYYAARYLKINGFKEIYNLDGGIKAWQKEGLPVIKGTK